MAGPRHCLSTIHWLSHLEVGSCHNGQAGHNSRENSLLLASFRLSGLAGWQESTVLNPWSQTPCLAHPTIPDALDFVDQWAPSRVRVKNGSRQEAMCSLPLALRKEAGEDEGCWFWRWRGAVAAHSLLSSVTLSLGTCWFLFPMFLAPRVPHFLAPSSSSFSCSLHDFQSLLHSACRHTLTCCMSPCGNPACHIIYLFNRKRLNHLISKLDIYRCIYWIVCLPSTPG